MAQVLRFSASFYHHQASFIQTETRRSPSASRKTLEWNTTSGIIHDLKAFAQKMWNAKLWNISAKRENHYSFRFG